MSTREPDNYARRMARSGAAAVVIHVACLALFALVAARTPVDAIGPGGFREEPLVLNLQPEPEGMRHFVDTAVPADAEVDPDTDLISDQASKASDIEDSEGERAAPRLDQISDIDNLAGPVTPEPPAPPESPAPEAVAEAPKPEPEESIDAEPESPAEEERELLAALDRIEEELFPLNGETQEDEREQMAWAEPDAAPAVPSQPRLGVSKSRPDGGAPGRGFVGFEALEHELGPYLKEIRDRVERHWRTMLEIRFSGTSRTQAVLECAISPQGKLVRAEIIEFGDSPTFAALCKQAIERAAPFPPFPFDVPAIYRTQNLEIRWTFSYM